MSHKSVAFAIPLAVLLVGAGAALAFAPSDAAPVAASATHAPEAEPMEPQEPVEVPAEAAPEPEPAAAEPTPAQPEPVVFEDILLRELGQVSYSYHESWQWMVPSDSFRAFKVDLDLGGVEDPEWIAYCVEAILRDGGGNEVARSTGALYGSAHVLDWSQGDAEQDTVWTGTWTLELHVQGATLTDYEVNVDVLY